jgi:hypothetical protein
MHREPTAISLVAMAMPSIPVRLHRAASENVVNSTPITAASYISPGPCSRSRICHTTRVVGHHVSLSVAFFC